MCPDNTNESSFFPPKNAQKRTAAEAAQYSPLTLAFLGDAVYSLLVRQRLVLKANRPAGKLHRESLTYVNAAAQSEAVKRILPLLTEPEAEIFRRGRNAHPAHLPKNQSEADYCYATALETLFGYWYLLGDRERIAYIFQEICGDDHQEENKN